MKERIDIKGMTCSACSSAVQKCMEKTDGVEKVSVNLLTNCMDIEYDENKVGFDTLAHNVKNIGYELVNPNNTKETNVTTYSDETAKQKKSLIASIILMIILFYISMGHMVGLWLPSFLLGHENSISFAFTQFLIALPIYYLNRKYFIRGFTSLFKKHPNMDSLIAIGSSSAMLYGIYAIYKLGNALGTNNMEVVHEFSMNLYFETGAMILTLISVGKYFEAKSKKKTSEAISKLVNLAPKQARVILNGNEVVKPIEQIMINDIVTIKAGETIPMDGIIIKGETSVDESMLTGESLPVDKKIDDSVYGGTINNYGYIEIKVTSLAKDSTLSKIVTLVENAANSKAPIAKFADNVSSIFVPSVLVIALVTFIVWFIISKDFELALNFGISVLVISCPCALGLATPVSIMVSTGKSASKGILIKDGDALELASKIKHIFLDKTGTITYGKPEVVDEYVVDSKLYNVLSSLEEKSSHPLAVAIINKYDKGNLQFDSFEELSGKGIKGKIKDTNYFAGNISLMKQANINTKDIEDKVSEFESKGYSVIYCAIDDKLLGFVGIADKIKESSIKAINRLHKLGIKVTMLTGDHISAASTIAKSANIDDVVAEVLPSQKQEIISKALGKEVVAMVGDGINDSPALMKADVGVAIGSGSDIALDSADVVLVKNDLNDVVTLIELSKKTLTNIKENLFWALIYNTIGIPLAAGVLYIPFGLKLNPMFGAFAMSMSSIFVVSNALRLRNFKTDEEKENKKEEISMEKTIKVKGMMCEHCVKHVTDALNKIDGVEANVSLENNEAKVTLTKEVSDDVLRNAIVDAGYEVVEIK